jgi:hypothetical protein
MTIAACALIALVVALALGHDERLERAPEAANDVGWAREARGGDTAVTEAILDRDEFFRRKGW